MALPAVSGNDDAMRSLSGVSLPALAAALVSIKLEKRGPFDGTMDDVLARMAEEHAGSRSGDWAARELAEIKARMAEEAGLPRVDEESEA